MGGMALRAPVLAAFFLIVTLATLAMPGSPNFIGEILILFGAFEDKFVFGVVASAGVALAAVYMIRVFQKSMHNRNADGLEAPDMDGLGFVAIVPVTLVIVALGVYPQLVLDRTGDAFSEPRPVAAQPAPQEVLPEEATPEGGAVPPGGGQQINPEELQQVPEEAP